MNPRARDVRADIPIVRRALALGFNRRRWLAQARGDFLVAHAVDLFHSRRKFHVWFAWIERRLGDCAAARFKSRWILVALQVPPLYSGAEYKKDILKRITSVIKA